MDALIEELVRGASPAQRWTMIVFALVMFGGWAGAYAAIVRKCFQERTYGLPLVAITTNVCWEFLFSFGVVAPHASVLLVWGNRLWFFVDLILVAQLVLYGKQSQENPWVRKHFYPILAGTFVASAIGLYGFCVYFNDVYGLAAAFMMSVMMGVLFPAMVFSRKDLRGLSYRAAWLMLVGNVGSAVFCYIWWPLQFADGTLVRPPHTAEPRSYLFVYFLYVIVPVLNAVYIYVLGRRRREIEKGGA